MCIRDRGNLCSSKNRQNLEERNSCELDVTHEDIVRFIKSEKIVWLGHVERTLRGRRPERILYGEVGDEAKIQTEKSITVGDGSGFWGRMIIRNRRRQRESGIGLGGKIIEWMRIVEEANVHLVL